MREGKGEGGKGKEKWKNEEACNEERKTNVKEKKQRKDERERKTNIQRTEKRNNSSPKHPEPFIYFLLFLQSRKKKL